MIQVLLRIVAPSAKRTETLDVMQCIKGPTQFSRGCCGCWIFRNLDEEGALTYVVRWETREQLEGHLRGERFRRLLPYIEMSVDPPEVEISTVDPLGGIDYLVSVIGST